MATGADALVRALERAGITIVFGVAGRHNKPLREELASQGVRLITLHSPTAAVLAATGWGRRTGKPAAAIAGPGHDPLTTLQAVARAREDEVAVVLLRTTALPPRLPGPPRPAAETPPAPQGHAKSVTVLTPTDDLRAALRHARDEARRAPSGPVALDLCPGFLTADALAEQDEDAPAEASQRPVASVEHVQLRRAGNLVDASQSVLIWAGGGALRAGAGGAVAELAEKVGAAVMTTVQAAGLLPARHPCLVGMPPHLPQVGRLWDDADLVIVIGSDLDEQATQGLRMPEPDSLIAINVDAVDAGRHYRPDVLLRGDARTLTKALADAVGYRGGTAVVRSRLEEVRASVRRDLAESDPTEVAFLAAVAAALPDRAAVVADPSPAGRWLAAFHEWTLPRTLLLAGEPEALGDALPLAIGAAAVSSAEPVVAVLDARGLLTHLGELAVIAAEKLSLTVLVVAPPAVEGEGRATPDLAEAARTFGLRADEVEGVDEALTTALRAHIAAPDPTVLVVRTVLRQPPTDEDRWYRRPEPTT